MTNPFEAPVTVLSKPACVQCDATYRHLDKLGIEYEVIDLSKDEVALQWAKDNNQLSAPVTVHPFGVIAGFNPDELNALSAKLA